MKKILFAIVIIMILGFSANAQRDGFFGGYESSYSDRAGGSMSAPMLHSPGTEIGDPSNTDAPLGSGLLILTALSAGYAARKIRKS